MLKILFVLELVRPLALTTSSFKQSNMLASGIIVIKMVGLISGVGLIMTQHRQRLFYIWHHLSLVKLLVSSGFHSMSRFMPSKVIQISDQLT